MLKKILVMFMVILASVPLCTSIFAVDKDTIIGYVNSQTVCGDTGLFNTYKSTFTRLLKQKYLTEDELNTVYSYLQGAVGILNSKGICKLADMGKLSESEKNTIYGYLTSGAGIITNAPLLSEYEEKDENIKDKEQTEITTNNSGTKITINTEDNTMDIYENGVLVDKVSLTSTKMTYTGANTTQVQIIVICAVIFILTLVGYILLVKSKKTWARVVKNISLSLAICSFIIGMVMLLFGTKIEKVVSMLDMLAVTNSETEINVELNEDKTIKKYPSYGLNYAKLTIPSVDVKSNVYYGDSTSILGLGIGHTSWSNMPTEGGVVVYSGHNREDILNNLKDVEVKDKIVVDTTYAKCTYSVVKTEILNDTEIDKLVKQKNKETLILYTCYPFDTYVYTNQRFVVYSVLKEIEWK